MTGGGFGDCIIALIPAGSGTWSAPRSPPRSKRPDMAGRRTSSPSPPTGPSAWHEGRWGNTEGISAHPDPTTGRDPSPTSLPLPLPPPLLCSFPPSPPPPPLLSHRPSSPPSPPLPCPPPHPHPPHTPLGGLDDDVAGNRRGGYIGSHVVRAFAAKGIGCVVIDDLSSGHRGFNRRTPVGRGERRGQAALHRIFDDHAVEGVVHLAGFKYAGCGSSILCTPTPET